MVFCLFSVDSFCNRRSFFVEDFAATVWALHTNVFDIKLYCFFTEATFISGHILFFTFFCFFFYKGGDFSFDHTVCGDALCGFWDVGAAGEDHAAFVAFPYPGAFAFYVVVSTGWAGVFDVLLGFYFADSGA